MTNKNKLISSIITLSLATSSINADTIGAEVGYASWNPSLAGTIKKGTSNIDFEKDLGFVSKQNNSFFWAYIDHPIPLLPNIKIQKINYSDESNGELTKSITFAGTNLGNVSTNTSTKFTLNQTDIIPYWRILDNWINFDIGLNIKNIDGSIKIDTTTNSVDEKFKITVPMAYAKARFDLPFSGLSLEADISTITYSGNKITDFNAGLSYNFIAGLGVVTGIKKQTLILNDVDNIDANIKISGMYLGLYYHF